MTLLANPPAGAQNTPPKPGPDTPPASDRGWFRAFLLRLHFYAGILAGPFLLIAAITGGSLVKSNRAIAHTSIVR